MKEDTGQILIVDKIVNNNIVIAKDFRGREVVAIGKGVGFRKRKNEAVHRSEIMKTYVLLDKVDSGVLTLFEEIQFEVIETSQKIIDYAQEKLNVKFNVNLLMSLSDHINFALIQYRQGNHVPKLVNEEVKRFYKEEYHIGEIAVQMINERFQILFPKDEATAIERFFGRQLIVWCNRHKTEVHMRRSLVHVDDCGEDIFLPDTL